jgi:hypothetical protein
VSEEQLRRNESLPSPPAASTLPVAEDVRVIGLRPSPSCAPPASNFNL